MSFPLLSFARCMARGPVRGAMGGVLFGPVLRMMLRMMLRTRVAPMLGLMLLPVAHAEPPAAHVLRVSTTSDVISLDPQMVSDVYSTEVLGHIHETLYSYHYLARPLRVRPQTAAALPEVSDDFRQFTIRLQPGIFFTDDPAFGGKPRELVAEDYVYAIKRNFDPAVKSPHRPTLTLLGILGLAELHQRASESGRAMDYDTPIEGLQALGRYTLRIRVARPSPRLVFNLAAGTATAAVAREVVQARGDSLGEHPVGTGPFKLERWVRGARLVLVRNPGYRAETYDEQAPADQPEAQASAAALRGRRLPMLERVEWSVIAEDQPLWLTFLRGDLDYAGLPYPFVPLALPGGQVAPHLAQRGIRARLTLRPDVVYTYFNMDDPVVGGYSPAQVALRRAISLGYDNHEEIRVLRRQLAAPAQSLVPPQTFGYDPTMKSAMSDHEPARARALLDLYGFVDRDGDGWRERPDGSPLLLRYASSQTLREFNELWQRHMSRLGIRIEFEAGQWTEQQKAARAGQLMMWFLSWNADQPDGGIFLRLAYGPAKGAENLSRFDLPVYNALYERIDALPDGPERLALIRQASRLLLAWQPIKAHVHRVGVGLAHPWVRGYHPNPFLRSSWKYLDVDPARPTLASAR